MTDQKCSGRPCRKQKQRILVLNFAIEVPAPPERVPVHGVGIDLGLKDFAALSNGEIAVAQPIYRDTEFKLADACRRSWREKMTMQYLRFEP